MSAVRTVEIYPGVSIEISERLLRSSGVGADRIIRPRLTHAERNAAMGGAVFYRKYSRMLLEEAVRLSKEVGVREASKITGVKYWSIVRYKTITRKIRERTKGRKYTPQQEAKFKALVQALMAGPPTHEINSGGSGKMRKKLVKWLPYPAHIEAARRLGMNGLYMENKNRLHQKSAQHCATFTATDGL